MAVALLIVVHKLKGIVVRVAVNNEVLHMGIGLLLHTFDGSFNKRTGIPCHGGYGNFKAFFCRLCRGRRHTVLFHFYDKYIIILLSRLLPPYYIAYTAA